jgi:hypothetical protein
VNTGVRTPRADRDDRMAGDEGKRGLYRVLDRPGVSLRLPAGIVGAVILDDGGNPAAEIYHADYSDRLLAGQILD